MPNIKTIKYLTQDELKSLLGIIETSRRQAVEKKHEGARVMFVRDKAIILVAYYHGLRASEIGMLKVDDVDIERGRIRIERLKRSQSGEYTLQPDEIKVLKTWLKERQNSNPWLFPTRIGTPIHRRTLDYLIKHYGKKAGISPEKCHFHVLKHSIATHLLDAGADIRFVQDWIGHKNIQNTVVYAQITNPARDKQATRLFASPMIV